MIITKLMCYEEIQKLNMWQFISLELHVSMKNYSHKVPFIFNSFTPHLHLVWVHCGYQNLYSLNIVDFITIIIIVLVYLNCCLVEHFLHCRIKSSFLFTEKHLILSITDLLSCTNMSAVGFFVLMTCLLQLKLSLTVWDSIIEDYET